jgi:DNA-directed RNA polymerase subunit RPC12/RpoP
MMLRCVACSAELDARTVARGQRCQCGGTLIIVQPPTRLEDRRGDGRDRPNG